jgi:hypothetical protein
MFSVTMSSYNCKTGRLNMSLTMSIWFKDVLGSNLILKKILEIATQFFCKGQINMFGVYL